MIGLQYKEHNIYEYMTQNLIHDTWNLREHANLIAF